MFNQKDNFVIWSKRLKLAVWSKWLKLLFDRSDNFHFGHLIKMIYKWLFREKVTTTNFTTSKTKKNIKKFVNHHYIESPFLVDHYYYNQNIENGFLADHYIENHFFLVHHYYENQNVEKNVKKNIENLSFVWFSHFDYLWHKYGTYGVLAKKK